jgi:hypothetical protein
MSQPINHPDPSHPLNHPDPRIRELAEINAGAHRAYEAERNIDLRIQFEKIQLAAKEGMYQIDRSIPYLAHDIEMHKKNVRDYNAATGHAQEPGSYARYDTPPLVGPGNGAAVRTPLRLAAGALALVSAVMVFLGSFLPFFTYTYGSSGVSTSIFKEGVNNSLSWYAAEPIIVLALAFAAGILLLATRRPRTWRAAAVALAVAGALIGLGIQTTMLFAGYAFSTLGTGSKHDIGGTVGVLGGIVLIAAGIAAFNDNKSARLG